MIITYPDYFNEFKCIASDCNDTCCVNWQVVIDEASAQVYETLKGNFATKLRSVITKDQDGDVVFINTNNRCPFLNENNLCDIHSNLGEEYLCYTCKMYPRFEETFGGQKEMGLSLSCPVANALILKDHNLILTSDFNEELPEINNLNAEEFMALKSLRNKALNHIKSNLPIKSKCNNLIWMSFKLKELLSKEKFNEIENISLNISDLELKFDFSVFENLEYLTPKGEMCLKQINSVKELKITEDYKNILYYFVYRYFLKSIYTGDTFQSLMFAVFSIQAISKLELILGSLEEASRLYSKEIEHSQNNINSIEEYLTEIKYPR